MQSDFHLLLIFIFRYIWRNFRFDFLELLFDIAGLQIVERIGKHNSIRVPIGDILYRFSRGVLNPVLFIWRLFWFHIILWALDYLLDFWFFGFYQILSFSAVRLDDLLLKDFTWFSFDFALRGKKFILDEVVLSHKLFLRSARYIRLLLRNFFDRRLCSSIIENIIHHEVCFLLLDLFSRFIWILIKLAKKRCDLFGLRLWRVHFSVWQRGRGQRGWSRVLYFLKIFQKANASNLVKRPWSLFWETEFAKIHFRVFAHLVVSLEKRVLGQKSVLNQFVSVLIRSLNLLFHVIQYRSLLLQLFIYGNENWIRIQGLGLNLRCFI